jgi:hypothetical protein
MKPGGSLSQEIERLRIAALRARLLGYDVAASRDFSVRRLTRNLVLLNIAVRRVARRGPLDAAGSRAAIFVARSYEQLAELPELDSVSLRMTAAVHYELAGFQANAATMARLAMPVRDFSTDGAYNLPELASLFLQGVF